MAKDNFEQINQSFKSPISYQMDQHDAWAEYELEYSELEATGLSLEEPEVEEVNTSETQGEPALGQEETINTGSGEKSTR